MRNARRASRAEKQSRRGTVLVWFAVLLFAMLPLVALIVHIGMATLARRQMQTAVNAAALDGLRLRDDTQTIAEKHDGVIAHVSAIYDDNLNSDNADAMQFGAGPAIEFDDEPSDIVLPGTDFRGSRTIRSENMNAYDPVLNRNEDNEHHGDMVSGQYQEAADHHEEATYLRSDFLIAGDTGHDSSAEDDAFLVRLRRTDSEFGPVSTLDRIDGVSSSGPTIPFLFGRGPYGGPAFLDRRERGTIVRATGIAQAVPAMTVGSPSNSTIGVAPIWVDVDDWNAMTTGTPANVVVTDSMISGELSGEFVSPGVVTVGEVLDSASPATVEGEHYIAIYGVLPSMEQRVVGFGIADVQLTSTGGTVTKRPSRIGTINASAKWSMSLRDVPTNDLSAFLGMRGSQSEPLLAPALRRTMH